MLILWLPFSKKNNQFLSMQCYKEESKKFKNKIIFCTCYYLRNLQYMFQQYNNFTPQQQALFTISCKKGFLFYKGLFISNKVLKLTR